jgi:hypothetical protein
MQTTSDERESGGEGGGMAKKYSAVPNRARIKKTIVVDNTD